MILKNLEPADVLRYFEEISAIPRAPRNEHAITDYLLKFAEERGLSAVRDDILNVIIKKPGSKEGKNSPPLILQGHTDMVCEKNNDTEHDFLKDPIKLVLNGDILSADGTTLGADNGVACAIMLALLDDDNISHPPLECVFTSQEEIGLIGATHLDFSTLEAKAMINLDSGTEHQFTVGCAGGIKAIAKLPLVREAMPQGFVCRTVTIKGLLGGHSGNDIHLQRGNANIMMARTLSSLEQDFGIRIVTIKGGAQDNAIPRECVATIALNPADEAEVSVRLQGFLAQFQSDLRLSDPGIVLTMEECSKPCSDVFTKDCASKLLTLVLLCPAGVLAMSLDIKGLVETSCNTAVIRTLDSSLEMAFMARSSVEASRDFVVDKIRMLCRQLGAEVSVSAGYPGWKYAPKSRLRDTAIEVYRNTYGREPLVEAKHSGLEGGIFVSNIPDLDCISMGSDLFALHSPDEHMSISSLDRTYTLLKAILAKL